MTPHLCFCKQAFRKDLMLIIYFKELSEVNVKKKIIPNLVTNILELLFRYFK